MNNVLLDLTPKAIWEHFREITLIPRPSKKEELINQYLVDFAKSHNLDYEQDAVGNVLIRKGGTPGMENRQTVILQSHVDMVGEKNSDKVHDFEKDPIEVYIENGWVKANGTTLGGDDGIGVAAQLAILAADNIEHGPIECLFTVDEETGLTGAFGLDENMLKGRILLNLDSEDEGELFIGCAGGKDTVIYLPYTKEKAAAGMNAYAVNISGLKGGHSGDDIHKGLANANKLINRILWDATKKFGVRLAYIEGGNLRNAIAREARASLLIASEHAAEFEAFVTDMGKKMVREYSVTEPNLSVTFAAEADYPEFVINLADQEKLLSGLYACPHGVIAWSQTIPDFVETSTNLAAVRMEADHFLITTSQRSSVESEKEDVANMVRATFELAGAKVEHSNGYPGWEPNPNSVIRDITVKSYKKLFPNEPIVKAIHAGLECGLIGDKYPGMDMISFGPTIKGAHSPDERMEISTVQKFWDLTLDILKSIPEV